jgi:hypothetical protein
MEVASTNHSGPSSPARTLRTLATLIVTALSWLIASNSWAQATRPYQMTILGSVDAHVDPRPSIISYNAGVDIPAFYFGRESAPLSGPMIVWLAPTHDVSIYDRLDWSRVVAVYVDEPYYHAVANSYGVNGNSPCIEEQPGELNPRTQVIWDMTSTLTSMAEAVRVRAPKARFWVNYTSHEVDWMVTGGCTLNHAFIDVVSVDIYANPFYNDVKSYNDKLFTNRPVPHQQLALIPGTHVSSQQSEAQAIAALPQYFQYADSANQNCTLPLGPVGTTGFYDGCKVWIVAGWTGGAIEYHEGPNYVAYPIEHPASQQVRAIWEEYFAKPRNPPAPDLSGFNRHWVPPVLKILLD